MRSCVLAVFLVSVLAVSAAAQVSPSVYVGYGKAFSASAAGLRTVDHAECRFDECGGRDARLVVDAGFSLGPSIEGVFAFGHESGTLETFTAVAPRARGVLSGTGPDWWYLDPPATVGPPVAVSVRRLDAAGGLRVFTGERGGERYFAEALLGYFRGDVTTAPRGGRGSTPLESRGSELGPSARVSGLFLSPGVGVQVPVGAGVSARITGRVMLSFFDRSADPFVDLGRASPASFVMNVGLLFGSGG